MALWYHFAIMFEALFILTTSTPARASAASCFRICGGHVWEPLGQPVVVPGDRGLERCVRLHVGILSLSGSDRSARRHQLPLAAVRNLEPAARRRWRCASAPP